MRTNRTRALLAGAIACVAAPCVLGCPTEAETFALAVRLVSPPDQQPLDGVDVLEMDVAYDDDTALTYYQTPATDGWAIEEVPAAADGALASLRFRGMAFDPTDDGNVLEVANGASPPVDLAGGEDVHVYFSQRHRLGRVEGLLARVRIDAQVAALPGGGALVVGGRSGSAPVDALAAGAERLVQGDDGRFRFHELGVEVQRLGAAIHAVDHGASAYDGRVLLLGGWEGAVDGDALTARVDAIDPLDETVETAFQLPVPLTLAVSTVLEPGRLLLSGGLLWDGDELSPSGAYIVVDLDADQPTLAGAMGRHRYAHGAVALGDGSVLVCGGLRRDGDVEVTTDECELWTLGGVDADPLRHLVGARAEFAVAPLPGDDDGRLLAAGGLFDDGEAAAAALDTAELFDPGLDGWRALDARMTEARIGPRLAPLPDGRLLMCGGYDTLGEPVASCELFDPGVEAFVPLPEVTIPGGRGGFALVGLDDGKLLLVGGEGADPASAYLYNP